MATITSVFCLLDKGNSGELTNFKNELSKINKQIDETIIFEGTYDSNK